MRISCTGTLLALLLCCSSAAAEDFGFDVRKLNSADVARALDSAEALLSHGSGKPPPLSAKEEAVHWVGWLGEVSREQTRDGVQAMETLLQAKGYQGQIVDAWSRDLHRILLAYDAIKRGVVGKDVSTLYKRLMRAKGVNLEALRYQIALGAVTTADAAVVKPHVVRIDALLTAARKGSP